MRAVDKVSQDPVLAISISIRINIDGHRLKSLIKNIVVVIYNNKQRVNMKDRKNLADSSFSSLGGIHPIHPPAGTASRATIKAEVLVGRRFRIISVIVVAVIRCRDVEDPRSRVDQGPTKPTELQLELLFSRVDALSRVHAVAVDHLLLDVASVPVHCDGHWVRKGARAGEVVCGGGAGSVLDATAGECRFG